MQFLMVVHPGVIQTICQLIQLINISFMSEMSNFDSGEGHKKIRTHHEGPQLLAGLHTHINTHTSKQRRPWRFGGHKWKYVRVRVTNQINGGVMAKSVPPNHNGVRSTISVRCYINLMHRILEIITATISPVLNEVC